LGGGGKKGQGGGKEACQPLVLEGVSKTHGSRLSLRRGGSKC
jgi:hypothetical protein